MKLIISSVVVTLLLAMSIPAWAFMPTNGLWNIDSELNGNPGRGFNIEVENGILLFIYYGYRADGTSLFYIADGQITNNEFSADLIEVQGGTPIGSQFRDGTVLGSPGRVTMSFSSGLHGTITLPGESPKAISKYGFGYGNNATGLLGTWMLSEIVSGLTFSRTKTLNTNTGIPTTDGNGLVTTSDGKFGCEYMVSGSTAGMVMCADIGGTAYIDGYIFKFSGDRGSGVNMYKFTSYSTTRTYEAHMLRTSTRTGVKTGLNDGTVASLGAYSTDKHSASALSLAPDRRAVKAATADKAMPLSNENIEQYNAFHTWAQEVSAIVTPIQ